jgi:hypothetical protein
VQVNNVESWNGSAWTEVADLNTARMLMVGGGVIKWQNIKA